MKLNELQNQFKDSLLYNISFDGLRALKNLEGQEGLGIYQTQYLQSHAAALKTNYPSLSNLLGNEATEIFYDYIHYNPSNKFSLHDYGEDLFAYLKPLNISRRFPFLPYLAHLEWKIKMVKDQRRPLPLKPFYIRRALESSDCHIKLIEAMAILRTPFSVYEIWRSPTQAYSEDMWRKHEDLLIHQKDDKLLVQKINAPHARFIFDLQRGLSLNEALAQNLILDTSTEELLSFLYTNELIEDVLTLDN